MGNINDGFVAGRVLAESVTNTDPNSCKTCIVQCEDQWSLAQLQCVGLVCRNGKLLEAVLPRARRTAGNYAALFLGDEGTDKAGRFYWPGLAAFAAKQVVEGIEYADKNLAAFVAQVRAMAGLSLYYLLKGNFWVFVEVTTWKLFYRDHGAELFFHCIDRRNVETYDPVAKKTMEALPWARGENTPLRRAIEKRIRAVNVGDLTWNKMLVQDGRGALAEMGQCRVTGYLKKGFEALRDYEQLDATEAGAERAAAAYQSAKEFLKHEQTLHLQAMIYDHPDFRFAWDNNDLGRSINRILPITGARDPDLVFHHDAAITPEVAERDLKPLGLTKDDVSERMALEDGKLYDVDARMRYVKRILDRYHRLMQDKRFRPYMIGQLQTISAWKNAT